MNKTLKTAGIILASSAFVIAMLAALQHVDQLPKESWFKHLRMPQGSLAAYQDAATLVKDLQGHSEAFLNAPLQFTSERGELSTNLAALGFSVDLPSFQKDLETRLNAKLPTKLKRLVFPETIELPLAWNPEPFHKAFQEAKIEQLFKNPAYAIKDGNLIVQEGQASYTVDQTTLLKNLNQAWDEQWTALAKVQLALKVQEPTLKKESFEQRLEEAKPLLARKIELTQPEGKVTDFVLKDQVGLLRPSEQGFTLDETALNAWVATEIESKVNAEPVGAKLSKAGEKVSFEGSARFGKKIDRGNLKQFLEAALKVPETTKIALPIITLKPEIDVPQELKDQGITDLVGVGYTTFYGSPAGRKHNIGVGVNRFNGMVIPTDTEFSFTANMGPIDASAGWVQELVIKGDETVPEYGGGLCQVSSTLYRAALFSGLPITARSNHSYAVSYYAQVGGPGLDATIYDPRPDLKFLNDTGAPLIIQSYTNDYEAYFVLYGKNDGRTVSMDGPYTYDFSSIAEPKIVHTDKLAPGERKFKDPAHKGFKADWYRTVTYPDGRVINRENIHSNYEARPAVYLEGQAAGETPNTNSGQPIPSDAGA